MTRLAMGASVSRSLWLRMRRRSLLVVVSIVLGLFAAYAALSLFIAIDPTPFWRSGLTGWTRVVLVTIAAIVLVGFRGDLPGGDPERASTSGDRRGGVESAVGGRIDGCVTLATIQVAVTVVLLSGAARANRNIRLMSTQPGFNRWRRREYSSTSRRAITRPSSRARSTSTSSFEACAECRVSKRIDDSRRASF